MSYKEKFLTKDIYVDQDIEQAIGRLVEYPRPQEPSKKNEPERSSQVIQLTDLDEESFTAPYDGLEVSLETYWNEFYGQTERTYEWNNGVLEVKPMAILIQVKAYLWFLNLLRDYLFANAIAEMTLLETAFKFNVPGKTKVRIPDLAVVLNSNPVPLGLHDHTYKGIFDICVESVSDSKRSEVERDTTIKRDEYAQGGVAEYYILDEKHPLNRKCEAAFYRLSPSGVYQPIPPVNGIIQSTVLPGFQFRVDDLADRPTPLAMLDDPVYQGFISPFLRAERERAERELRAEQERAARAKERAARALQAEQERAALALQAEQERAAQAKEQAAEEKERAARALQAEQEQSEQALQAKQEKIDQLSAYLIAQGISLPDDFLE